MGTGPTKEKDGGSSLATGLFPHGLPNPCGAAWEGRAPMDVSVNK